MPHGNMRPIFCIDITADKKNDTLNGEEFITRTASQNAVEEYEEKQENFDRTIEKSKLPLWLRIVEYLFGIYALIVASSVIRVGFGTAMKNAPWLVISAGFCGVIWVVIFIFSRAKEKRVLIDENADVQVEEMTENFIEIHKELGVPTDAQNVDILAFRYKIKEGRIVPRTVAFQSTPFINIEVKLFVEDDTLNIAELSNVYSVKISELKAIYTVKKRISVPSWNKEIGPKEDIYKPYKMTVNNVGDVYMKSYHVLELERDGAPYCIYFPCYELEHFERLTGLKAIEE